VYVFNLLTGTWTLKKPVYGKVNDRRLFGHSGAYYAETQSIIIYGGYNPASKWYVSTNMIIM